MLGKYNRLTSIVMSNLSTFFVSQKNNKIFLKKKGILRQVESASSIYRRIGRFIRPIYNTIVFVTFELGVSKDRIFGQLLFNCSKTDC